MARTVVLLSAPLSVIELSATASVTVGGGSLSVMVSVVPFTSSPVTVPSTVTVSFGSSMVSLTGVRVKVAIPLSASAAIVSVPIFVTV